jgi:hypothetical protein
MITALSEQERKAIGPGTATHVDRRTQWYSRGGPQKLRALQDATECSRINRSAADIAKLARAVKQ